jgi:NAD(P)-dependent dehydrogenase (short-subunit alcohol dehydrogenase family)
MDHACRWPGTETMTEAGFCEDACRARGVVTAAASGIGLALAERLAHEAMTVVLADLPGDRLDTAVGAFGGSADVHGVTLDLARLALMCGPSR